VSCIEARVIQLMQDLNGTGANLRILFLKMTTWIVGSLTNQTWQKQHPTRWSLLRTIVILERLLLLDLEVLLGTISTLQGFTALQEEMEAFRVAWMGLMGWQDTILLPDLMEIL